MLVVTPDAIAQQLPTAIPQTKFSSGQDIQPYFEGWIRNADGTIDMVFGYFNRNWQEELAIPPGPDNLVEPGGPDRGQPTYFLPRRQGWVYRVRVPKDFGKQVVTWTIKANGKTEKAYGELLPVEEITERIIMTRGNLNPGEDDPNRPPAVAIAPVEGATAGTSVPLIAQVTDDGLPKPRVVVARPKTRASDGTTIQAQANSSAEPRPRGLTVSWMQLRGPAKIAFDPSGPIPVAAGKGTVTARFSQPGIYVLRATANDGALSTKSDATISVGAQAGTKPLPIVDNDRVVVWDCTWTPGVPTPMHFHDKDVVVTYVEQGALKATGPDGQSTTNEFMFGTVRFNARDRVHTELLVSPKARAIITELK